MKPYITKDTPVTEEVLNAIAYLPTKSLPKLVEDGFFQKLTDKDFMRIGVLLAMKGYEEGGSPIGGVIIDNATRRIVGKGHNTLVQESHPYNHGETSAARDAGRPGFQPDDDVHHVKPLRHLCSPNPHPAVSAPGHRRRHQRLRQRRNAPQKGHPGRRNGRSRRRSLLHEVRPGEARSEPGRLARSAAVRKKYAAKA